MVANLSCQQLSPELTINLFFSCISCPWLWWGPWQPTTHSTSVMAETIKSNDIDGAKHSRSPSKCSSQVSIVIWVVLGMALWLLVVQPAILSNLHSIQITTSHIVYSYEPPGIIQQSTPGYKYVNFLRSKGCPENWSWFLHYSLLDSFIISSLRVSRSVLSRGYRRLLLPRMDYLSWHCLPVRDYFHPSFHFPELPPLVLITLPPAWVAWGGLETSEFIPCQTYH